MSYIAQGKFLRYLAQGLQLKYTHRKAQEASGMVKIINFPLRDEKYEKEI